ncbi:ribonuclease P protein component [Corynebacterium caspium]|uniref:ribonuclease P protein component n=1 Tax=Corynebacterium caspium TaxID=234828 RepID=UPI00035CE214|nr:ribonuclease P protein component [Corynebacterium caspium]WKD60065.1 Ribonuclease P protein component [Corynebacterium caspium DSM 44850]
MLPPANKLTSPAQFRRVIKGGRRTGKRNLVLHVATVENPVICGGPRCGLVVSKAVGNAVIRHRTSRRLRHVLAALIASGELPKNLEIVVRALPRAGKASSEELQKDLRAALNSLISRTNQPCQANQGVH